METTLTEHARMRLEERGISLDEVIHVVKFPTRKFYDLKTSHLVAVGPRDTGEQWLIIAYEEEVSEEHQEQKP
jgi:hypothetical protein